MVESLVTGGSGFIEAALGSLASFGVATMYLNSRCPSASMPLRGGAFS